MKSDKHKHFPVERGSSPAMPAFVAAYDKSVRKPTLQAGGPLHHAKA
jgi:hypothetical protein